MRLVGGGPMEQTESLVQAVAPQDFQPGPAGRVAMVVVGDAEAQPAPDEFQED